MDDLTGGNLDLLQEDTLETISQEDGELRNERKHIWSLEDDLEKMNEETSFWSAFQDYLPSKRYIRRTEDRHSDVFDAQIAKIIELKNAQHSRRLANSKEKKLNRNRLQYRRKLNKNLQQIKRKIRLSRLRADQETTKQSPNIIFILADDLGKFRRHIISMLNKH